MRQKSWTWLHLFAHFLGEVNEPVKLDEKQTRATSGRHCWGTRDPDPLWTVHAEENSQQTSAAIVEAPALDQDPAETNWIKPNVQHFISQLGTDSQ